MQGQPPATIAGIKGRVAVENLKWDLFALKMLGEDEARNARADDEDRHCVQLLYCRCTCTKCGERSSSTRNAIKGGCSMER